MTLQHRWLPGVTGHKRSWKAPASTVEIDWPGDVCLNCLLRVDFIYSSVCPFWILLCGCGCSLFSSVRSSSAGVSASDAHRISISPRTPRRGWVPSGPVYTHPTPNQPHCARWDGHSRRTLGRNKSGVALYMYAYCIYISLVSYKTPHSALDKRTSQPRCSGAVRAWAQETQEASAVSVESSEASTDILSLRVRVVFVGQAGTHSQIRIM